MGRSVYSASVIRDRNKVFELDTASIFITLGESGVIVFRDCFNDVGAFSSFIKTHSSRLSLDPGRTLEGE